VGKYVGKYATIYVGKYATIEKTRNN